MRGQPIMSNETNRQRKLCHTFQVFQGFQRFDQDTHQAVSNRQRSEENCISEWVPIVPCRELAERVQSSRFMFKERCRARGACVSVTHEREIRTSTNTYTNTDSSVAVGTPWNIWNYWNPRLVRPLVSALLPESRPRRPCSPRTVCQSGWRFSVCP